MNIEKLKERARYICFYKDKSSKPSFRGQSRCSNPNHDCKRIYLEDDIKEFLDSLNRSPGRDKPVAD